MTLARAAGAAYRDPMSEPTHEALGPVDAIVRQADEMQRQRLEIMHATAEAAVALQDAEKAYQDALASYRENFKLATRAGWKDTELTGKLGLPSPTAAPRKRAARRTATPAPDQHSTED